MWKICVLLTLLGGCDTREKYEDVSMQVQSSEAVGRRYEVVGNLYAYGIRPHSKAQVEQVLLIPPPGIDGTMVGFRETVPSGAIVTVRRVVRTNRVFENDMNLAVELEGVSLPVRVPVTIELMRGNEGKGYLELNPTIFRKLPPK